MYFYFILASQICKIAYIYGKIFVKKQNKMVYFYYSLAGLGNMQNKEKIKLAAVITVSIVVCVAAVYLSSTTEEDSVYTGLFYIPVILTGLWFFRAVIPLAVFFALIQNALHIIRLNHPSILGGLILITGSVILYCLERNIEKKNRLLNASHHSQRMDKERLRITLLSIGDGVISTDREGRITLINEVAETLTGWTDQSAIGRPFHKIFTIVNQGTRERCPDPVRQVLDRGETVELSNHTILIAKDGTERAISDSAAPIVNEDGTLGGVVLVFRDITNEKIKQDEIKFLSYHDELTGLGNRRYLEEQITQLDHANNQMPISVIMGDVNGLKVINDAFGHAAGDQLLKKAAETLKASCRSNDVISRYGGDEFLILLPRTNEAVAKRIAMRLYESVGKIEINPVHFSMSLGWATKQDVRESMVDTIKTAEEFMYRRKLYESPSTRDSIIQSVMTTLKGNGGYEMLHSDHIDTLCDKVGIAFGLDQDDVQKLRTACQYHDIGKIAIDPAILNKEGPLTPEEWKIIKRHPETGYRLLSAVPEFGELAEYILAHHERWDGKGYPKKLKGEAIPYLSRIIMVAGAYDAMISKRPYREKPLTQAEAAAELRKNAGTQFDPGVVKQFVEQVLGEEW